MTKILAACVLIALIGTASAQSTSPVQQTATNSPDTVASAVAKDKASHKAKKAARAAAKAASQASSTK